MDLEFSHPEDPNEGATFGDLRRFVEKGVASGVTDDHPLILETEGKGGDVSGFSVFLPVDF